jgi:signal transduction histidine kinase
VGEAFRRQQPVRNLALRGADPARPAAELLASVFPVPDGGSVVGGMIFVKNPEPIRQIQSLYDYSRKLDELGQLTSGVAHEVKNPLNAMIIHLELLHQKLREAPEDVAQNLEVLREEIRRLDRVVQGFLRFIRPQAVQFLPVDLNTLLQHVVQLTRAEWEQVGITFVVHLDPAIPAVNGDAALLQQAFLNLVLNACQAMPDGGAVTLRTERASDGTIRAQVIDEGIGIPREDLDKVFRLYYTTKPDGSGIGLSLVYRIVQMHGGTIAVDSTVGSGTAITVTLPGPQAG